VGGGGYKMMREVLREERKKREYLVENLPCGGEKRF
jgi:hypothetical protein